MDYATDVFIFVLFPVITNSCFCMGVKKWCSVLAQFVTMSMAGLENPQVTAMSFCKYPVV